ncbi:MAG: sugar ABC transporter ATP-binding protein [Chloroflexi bacterium]|nr:sugar ABC transporter ATP-binding protein [Chloroflexota bacterium]
MESDYILLMENVSKSFPGVKALDNVQLAVRRGAVHALMGENGAGKSTLMKVLIGMYPLDSGSITFNGEKVSIQDTAAALKMGISMIHQELSPVPYMTVAENIFLGREPLNRMGLIDKKLMIANTRKLLERLEINVDPSVKMKNISIASTQMVEIAKAISYDSSLIVMDEPTSAITEREVEHLFRMIRALKAKGVSIIYITHKLDEVFKISDEITVFRDGRHIATVQSQQTDKNNLIAMMVGRELTNIFPKEEAAIGEVVMAVKNINRKGKVRDVSFELRRGEIVGLAGLMGAGRTEVIESIFGIARVDSGEIYIKGQKARIHQPHDAIRHGMALLTEDRKLTGIMSVLSVRDNMIVASLGNFTRRGFLRRRAINETCEQEKSRLEIKTPSMDQLIKLLSGGNQQKVLVSRWLLTSPDILILDEPTRGIDVGAKAEIHRLMSRLAQEGKAILMVSSELPEILGMSDRVLVMHEGRLAGEFSRAEASQEKIMHAATGNAAVQ